MPPRCRYNGPLGEIRTIFTASALRIEQRPCRECEKEEAEFSSRTRRRAREKAPAGHVTVTTWNATVGHPGLASTLPASGALFGSREYFRPLGSCPPSLADRG